MKDLNRKEMWFPNPSLQPNLWPADAVARILISVTGYTPRMQPDVCRLPLPARQAVWCLLRYRGQGDSVRPPRGHLQVLADVESQGMKGEMQEAESCGLHRSGEGQRCITANPLRMWLYLDNRVNYFHCEWSNRGNSNLCQPSLLQLLLPGLN